MKKIVLVLLIGSLVCGGLVVGAMYDQYIMRWIIGSYAPNVVDFWNNKTQDNSTYFVVGGDTGHNNSSIFFNVTPDDVIDTWYWSVNGVTISNNYDNYSYEFGRGYNYITCYGENLLGTTEIIEWRPYVLFDRGSPVSGFNTTRYDELMTILEDAEDFPGLLEESTYTYRDFIGDLFFVFLFGIIFVMMWIRQESVVIPATIGVMLGGVMIAMLPAEWHRIATAFIMLGVVGVLYTIYKSRY